MIISFSMTARLSAEQGKKDPLLEGIKTVTRRDWSDRCFHGITKQWDAGYRRHDAWTNMPYVSGAKRLGYLDLTCRPYQETLVDMPAEDVFHEGNLWQSKYEFIEMLGICPDKKLTVVRFDFVPLVKPVRV